VGPDGGSSLATAELQVTRPPGPSHLAVWVHADADRDGAVSPGDYLTTASYPLPEGEEDVILVVTVNRV